MRGEWKCSTHKKEQLWHTQDSRHFLFMIFGLDHTILFCKFNVDSPLKHLTKKQCNKILLLRKYFLSNQFKTNWFTTRQAMEPINLCFIIWISPHFWDFILKCKGTACNLFWWKTDVSVRIQLHGEKIAYFPRNKNVLKPWMDN